MRYLNSASTEDLSRLEAELKTLRRDKIKNNIDLEDAIGDNNYDLVKKYRRKKLSLNADIEELVEKIEGLKNAGAESPPPVTPTPPPVAPAPVAPTLPPPEVPVINPASGVRIATSWDEIPTDDFVILSSDQLEELFEKALVGN